MKMIEDKEKGDSSEQFEETEEKVIGLGKREEHLPDIASLGTEIGAEG